MSAGRTAAAPHPERAWRETFLARFDPDRHELLERFGGLLLTLANGGGYLPHRALGAIRGPLVAAARDLEHLALYLREVAATPVHSEVSRPELDLCHEASGWADYLEDAVRGLRRDAGSADPRRNPGARQLCTGKPPGGGPPGPPRGVLRLISRSDRRQVRLPRTLRRSRATPGPSPSRRSRLRRSRWPPGPHPARPPRRHR